MHSIQDLKTSGLSYSLITVLLRAGLVVALVSVGWAIHHELPYRPLANQQTSSAETTLRIILRPALGVETLDIRVELYPVDIVAVRHEYFTERREGKPFDDFLSERMKGRDPITARLDRQGQTSIVMSRGSWWIHAVSSGEEDLEWRLPVNVAGRNQTVELTSQNVYTRTRSF